MTAAGTSVASSTVHAAGSETEKLICELGSEGGWFLPLVDAEQAGLRGTRGFAYALVMIWTFLGVSIVADMFVASIETIANQKRQRLVNGRNMTSKVWNDTVATLTLMALGSSAPEIFFSVMDLIKRGFRFGALGPSTIIGSAAFNLLVIVGVCIIAIPSDEIRFIKDLPAYYVTAAFSIIAYVWMGLILVQISPDVIELWEALVTLFLMPCLVYISYKVDVGDCDCILKRLNLLAESERTSGDILASFSEEGITVLGSPEVQTLSASIMLSEKSRGPVACTYRTEALTAVPGYDYVSVDDPVAIKIGAGQTAYRMEFSILPKPERRATCKFLVIAEGLSHPCHFNKETDGGEDCAILTVTIDTVNSNWSRLDAFISLDSLRKGAIDWVAKVPEAIFVNGSLEEQREARLVDWILHILSLPWKLLFVAVPPVSLFGGRCAFVVSMGFIALLSALLSDLAEMFGCVLSVPDIVTSVTFVALGTSVPDLFASLSAARADPTADASIVNVTGSNSVNVFLGLGVTWTIGSIYWGMKGEDFLCDSRDLDFSILVFFMTSLAAFLILYLRRKVIGGELGGHFPTKIASFCSFVTFWFGFVSLVSWRATRRGKYSVVEEAVVLFCVSFALLLILAWPLVMLYLQWREKRREKKDTKANDIPQLIVCSRGMLRQKTGSIQPILQRSEKSGVFDIPPGFFSDRPSVVSVDTTTSEAPVFPNDSGPAVPGLSDDPPVPIPRSLAITLSDRAVAPPIVYDFAA